MKVNPKVSVIIPVYNPGKYLYRCLDAIVNQTYRNLEILLVDDGSTDGSGQVCDDYARRDGRIRVIHQQNAGVSRARNVGLEMAAGDYYHFPDSDDFIDPDTYESCLKVIEEHNCDAVVFEHYGTYSDYEDRHKSPPGYYGLYEGKEEIIKIFFRIAFTCNKFFSKKLITASDTSPGIKFREDIYRGEDSIFSREALFRAERVWFTDEAFYHYVQSEESACRGVFRPSQLSLLKTIDITKSFFEEHFPDYLPQLEVNELESCIMLYADMYSDKKDYRQEQALVYSRFKSLFVKCSKMPVNMKQQIKFRLFRWSPALFCKLHAVNVRRLER